jgi:hypothetical protein
MMEELDTRTSEFEQLLQKIASAITNGVLSEKLPPSKLLEKTENYVARATEEQPKSMQNKTEKRQLSLSNFKAEGRTEETE